MASLLGASILSVSRASHLHLPIAFAFELRKAEGGMGSARQPLRTSAGEQLLFGDTLFGLHVEV